MNYQLTHIKNILQNTDIQFFMRSKVQEEYHPLNIKEFASESFRIAYILSDIASLVTDKELSFFLSNMANKMQKNRPISSNELSLIKLTLRNCYNKCMNNRYTNVAKEFDLNA